MNTRNFIYSPLCSSAVAGNSTFCSPFTLNMRRCRVKNADLSTSEPIAAVNPQQLNFRKITPADMPQIWSIMCREKGRTTDFSYGGLLMWVDYFHYEFAVVSDTLFIKGRVESDVSKVAFSLPIGQLPLKEAVELLRRYCRSQNIPLIFSAVPEYALADFEALCPISVEPLTDWADYLYDAQPLATLRGKKMSKKRNHVNQFLAAYPDYSYQPLDPLSAAEALAFMDHIDAEGDHTPMAETERRLNREMLRYVENGDPILLGGVLRDGAGHMLAFTIGDIKGDTLFIHIEKALREVPGGFEMINKSFAEAVCANHPEIRYINREDDAGDEGLRMAKESYHPIELLRKYNIIM